MKQHRQYFEFPTLRFKFQRMSWKVMLIQSIMNLGMIKKKLFKPTVPIVAINGIISELMTSKVDERLKKIDPSIAKALAVSINSRGGLPVQSQIIVHKLKHFCKEHHLPLLTFAEDVAASGGYMILCAGDQVFADRTSIVGSIGVVFQRLNLKGLKEWGSLDERRITTDKKSILNFTKAFDDPDPEATETVTQSSKKMHKLFIDFVEDKRGQKLKVQKDNRHNEIYDAKVFTGEEAAKLGLVDRVGSLVKIVSELYPDCRIEPHEKGKSEWVKKAMKEFM